MIFAILLTLYVAWVWRSGYTIYRDNGKKYLTRYYLCGSLLRRLFNRNLFLHVFHSDDDSEYHNHRWEFSYGLILWGGYLEWRQKLNEIHIGKRYLRQPFSINRLDSEVYHRVELWRSKCVTLFYAGPFALEDWSFLKADGSIEYARDRFAGRRDDLSND